jgi:hypothetical protein
MLQRWPPNILGKRIFRDSLVDYKRLKFYIHTENFLECSGRIPPLSARFLLTASCVETC